MSDFQLFIDAIKSGSDGEIENKFKIEYLEMTDKNSWRPLHHAGRYGRSGLVKLLLSKHCNIDSRTNSGYQPVHFAYMNGHIDIVKILIENKCDINAADNYGYQPIHSACRNGHIDIVKILIANKCDINACNNLGFRPIHFACGFGFVDIVKLLIEHRCNINDTNNNKCQPIHLACEYWHADVVQILIDNRCDMNGLRKYRQSPIDIARLGGYQPIIDIIIAGNLIDSIAQAMDLYCKADCDHLFCRKSLEDVEFKKGEFIGSGSFGKVYKYKISNTNREIVIKRTKHDHEDKKNIEININKYSRRILHRNIVRYFGALEKSGKLCIYMEYMSGGSVKKLIKKSKWIGHSKVIKFSKEILNGLQFIHSQGIIHRDIKPHNMLLDHDETLKLTDFGLSKSLRYNSIFETTGKTVSFCGTPNYMAPEVLLREQYDFRADIWSTGASIIHMITGNIPYHSLRGDTVKDRIATTKKIEFTPCQPISAAMQSFIDDLLTPEQSERPSAKSLLKHSIFIELKRPRSCIEESLLEHAICKDLKRSPLK